MTDAIDGTPPGARLAIVSRTATAQRPAVCITRAMPDWMTPEAAVLLAQARAREQPGHRFQVLHQPPGCGELRILWDSHAPS